MSPIIFRDYTMDIKMSIYDSQDWRDGEKEDRERIEKHRADGTPMWIWGGEVSERSLNKDIKDKEDRWDLKIAFEKKYEMFRREEKIGIGLKGDKLRNMKVHPEQLYMRMTLVQGNQQKHSES